MKKVLPIIMITISIIIFIGLLIIPIYEAKISTFFKTIIYLGLGYLSITLFAIGWPKIKKGKNNLK